MTSLIASDTFLNTLIWGLVTLLILVLLYHAYQDR